MISRTALEHTNVRAGMATKYEQQEKNFVPDALHVLVKEILREDGPPVCYSSVHKVGVHCVQA